MQIKIRKTKINKKEGVKLNKKINDNIIINNKVITLNNEITNRIIEKYTEIIKRKKIVLINSEEINKFRKRLDETIAFEYRTVQPTRHLFYFNEELEILKEKIDSKKLELKIINNNAKDIKKNKIILQNNIVYKFINREINEEELLTCLYYLEKKVEFCISKYSVIRKITQCCKKRLEKELEELVNKK